MFSFPSRTVTYALTLLPILSAAFDKNKTLDWVYDKMPSKFKATCTQDEFVAVYDDGKAFMQSMWNALHKNG